MDSTVKLKSSEKDLIQDPTTYCRLVGKLLYLTISKPDIKFTVQPNQFMTQPDMTHMDATNHLLRYINGSLGQQIFLFKTDDLSLKAFANTN